MGKAEFEGETVRKKESLINVYACVCVCMRVSVNFQCNLNTLFIINPLLMPLGILPIDNLELSCTRTVCFKLWLITPLGVKRLTGITYQIFVL